MNSDNTAQRIGNLATVNVAGSQIPLADRIKILGVTLARLSSTNLLSAPFVRTSFDACSFGVAAPKIWNSLPLSLPTCTSPDTFRRHLKTHYCQQAFHST